MKKPMIDIQEKYNRRTDLVIFLYHITNEVYIKDIYDLKGMIYDKTTVKHFHVVTSARQSPVLKGHILLVLSQKMSYELNLF